VQEQIKIEAETPIQSMIWREHDNKEIETKSLRDSTFGQKVRQR
jgi:hypothetical protein